MILFISLTVNINAQENIHKPVFDFTSIDSLEEYYLETYNTTDPSSILVLFDICYLGSFTEANGKYSHHENHFDIYALHFKNKVCRLQKINNFGKYEEVNIKLKIAKKIIGFISTNFDVMDIEVLSRKVDTIKQEDGTIITSIWITDHQALYNIKVRTPKGYIKYKYQTDYDKNEENFKTQKYALLMLLDRYRSYFDRKSLNLP